MFAYRVSFFLIPHLETLRFCGAEYLDIGIGIQDCNFPVPHIHRYIDSHAADMLPTPKRSEALRGEAAFGYERTLRH